MARARIRSFGLKSSLLFSAQLRTLFLSFFIDGLEAVLYFG